MDKTNTNIIDSSKNQWNLELLYSGDNDPRIEVDIEEGKNAAYTFINKWKSNTAYLEDPNVLSQALQEEEKLNEKQGILEKPYYYFALRKYLEQDNDAIKRRLDEVEKIGRQIDIDFEFFSNSISKIPLSKQQEFLASQQLERYRYPLSRLFEIGKHKLSESEEKIFTLTQKSGFSNWVDFVSEQISKESAIIERKEYTFEDLIGNFQSTNKVLREKSAKAFDKILEKHSDLATQELNSILEYQRVEDEVRGFKRPDSSRHLSDAMQSETVDALISAVTKRFDISQRYYALKARILNVKKLRYFERAIPVGKNEKSFSYDDAKNIVLGSFKKLDNELFTLANKFFDESRIDVESKKGKHGGAFCIHIHKNLPVYVLLNYTNKLRDVTTLAHELGHGLNDVLMASKQPNTFCHTVLSTAEVASTFFEDFTLEEISNRLDEQEKRLLILNKLEDEIASVFRQIAFYNFETELHTEFRKKAYLSKDEIGTMFVKHMKSYLGDTFTFTENDKNAWVYISHFRRSFYVYSYANGLLISKSMQAMVKKDPATITKVKEFLSAGTSTSPEEIFKRLSIDITDPSFWEQGLNEIDTLMTTAEKAFSEA